MRMAIRSRINNTYLFQAFSILDSKSRKRIKKIALIQLILGGLDLIGVGIIGVIGALSVAGIKSGATGGRLSIVIQTLGLDSFQFQEQVAILGTVAVFILVGKTVISAIYTKRILLFLGNCGADLSTWISRQIFHKSLLFVRSRNVQEILYSSTSGVNALALGVLGGTITLISDVSLTVIIGIALVFIDPVIASIVFVLFALVLYSLNKVTQGKSQSLGESYSKLSITSSIAFEKNLRLFREIQLKRSSETVSLETSKLRGEISRIAAEISFLPNLSKYVIESSIIVGALLLSAFQFLAEDSSHAIATLSVFLAAGTRIAPALLRIQQGILVIRNSTGAAIGTLQLIRELKSEDDNYGSPPIKQRDLFVPKIVISDLVFRFDDSETSAVKITNLEIPSGSRVALVGPSGSGKSTLVDLILGVIPPTLGRVEISGMASQQATQIWPGSVGYVPQDVWLFDGSLRDNIFLWRDDVPSEMEVLQILEQANLTTIVQEMPDGLESILGSQGVTLSGGQRQRVGIARALAYRPQLLILDEATSSLDSTSEQSVIESIANLPTETTVIVIAHRLASIMNTERILYMDQGEIIAEGNFQQLRRTVPNFDSQASLMGLA